MADEYRLPPDAPDPETIAAAEEEAAKDPTVRQPHTKRASDPTDPIARRGDATHRE
jgi:hypothetical protein